ncbi:MAG: hypothetical protein LBR35_00565 [Rickettsiales bacterium]|jgi:hypothetical protein|nr:hypothetical protein [Rickettsiales bacterium]
MELKKKILTGVSMAGILASMGLTSCQRDRDHVEMYTPEYVIMYEGIKEDKKLEVDAFVKMQLGGGFESSGKNKAESDMSAADKFLSRASGITDAEIKKMAVDGLEEDALKGSIKIIIRLKDALGNVVGQTEKTIEQTSQRDEKLITFDIKLNDLVFEGDIKGDAREDIENYLKGFENTLVYSYLGEVSKSTITDFETKAIKDFDLRLASLSQSKIDNLLIGGINTSAVVEMKEENITKTGKTGATLSLIGEDGRMLSEKDVLSEQSTQNENFISIRDIGGGTKDGTEFMEMAKTQDQEIANFKSTNGLNDANILKHWKNGSVGNAVGLGDYLVSELEANKFLFEDVKFSAFITGFKDFEKLDNALTAGLRAMVVGCIRGEIPVKRLEELKAAIPDLKFSASKGSVTYTFEGFEGEFTPELDTRLSEYVSNVKGVSPYSPTIETSGDFSGGLLSIGYMDANKNYIPTHFRDTDGNTIAPDPLNPPIPPLKDKFFMQYFALKGYPHPDDPNPSRYPLLSGKKSKTIVMNDRDFEIE